MYRRGHYGITLLALAPIVFFLVRDTPVLVFLFLIGVATVERLPDLDFQIPGIRHRGTSHSIVAAVVVGSLLGASGWMLSGSINVNDLFLAVPAVLSTVLDGSEFIRQFLPHSLNDSIQLLIADLTRHARVLAESPINRQSAALFGFCVGVYGIIVHLLGDMITTTGIQPFLPFSQWRISISPLRASSPTANTGLFMLGMLTLGGAILGGGL
jgi:membrane-bound metal-dependent hydrolase YbcI (DUF457 family)